MWKRERKKREEGDGSGGDDGEGMEIGGERMGEKRV